MDLPKNEYRISITSLCNMKCVYCHNEGNHCYNYLKKEDIEKLILASKDLGLLSVRLTGGEPTMHKDFLHICKMIKDDYGLKIGVNTNAILDDIILEGIDKGYIDRVVVGIDFINGDISKMSPIGKSSKEILDSVLKFKEHGCDVSISTVFSYDVNNTTSLLNWAINNDVRIKILEVEKNEICNDISKEYKDMMDTCFKLFKMDKGIDRFKQVYGIIDDKIVVNFYHSHCRLRECDICKILHLRVTSLGKLKQCLHYDDEDIYFLDGDIRNNVVTCLERDINYHYDENIIENKKVRERSK